MTDTGMTVSKFGKYTGSRFVGAVATLEKRGVTKPEDSNTGGIDGATNWNAAQTLELEDVWMIRPGWRGHGPVTENSFDGDPSYRDWLNSLRDIAPIEFSFPDADWDGWRPLFQ